MELLAAPSRKELLLALLTLFQISKPYCVLQERSFAAFLDGLDDSVALLACLFVHRLKVHGMDLTGRLALQHG
jgi:hypothetical protein